MQRSIRIAFFILSVATASLLSGSKKVYKEGDVLNMFVNGLTSSKTHIPYEYYHLPFPKVGPFLHFHAIAKGNPPQGYFLGRTINSKSYWELGVQR